MLWSGVLLLGLAAGALWIAFPGRPEARALLTLGLLLYFNACLFELIWRRTRRKDSPTVADVREICRSAERADPASQVTLIEHVVRGTAAEVRLALIALANIGEPALGLLVVCCEQGPEPAATLLRGLAGRISGRSFASSPELSAWWQQERLAHQLRELERRAE